MNNDILGNIYFSFVPDNGAKDVSARNCSQTTKEQANTISKVKLNKIGFRVLVYGFCFKIFINKEEINIHKLIQN